MNARRLRSAQPSTSLLRTAVVGVALLSGLACSAILKPRDDVSRCGTADDCPGTGNPRYVPVCKFDDEHSDLDSTKVDKICLASFNPNVSCDESVITNDEDPFKKAVSRCAAKTCETDQLGKAGCAPDPNTGSCENGLELEDYNGTQFCNDPDADQPVIPSSVLGGADLIGQDVRDMFCKSYFCDDTFVCGPSKKCIPCDPEKEYGDGGCGIVYQAGPAPAYVLGGDLESVCDINDAPNTKEPHFGDACG